MKPFHYVRADLSGLILGQGSLVASKWEDIPVPKTEQWISVPAPIEDVSLLYVRNGALATAAPKPGEHYKLNPVKGTWEIDAQRAMVELRSRRNVLLAATDWMVLRAQDTGSVLPKEWQTYRQALRDITEQPDPLNVVWPTPPLP